MSFRKPVYVGDLISCYTDLISINNSSVEIKVDTLVTRAKTEEDIKVTDAIFTYVALDKDGNPRII